MTSGPSGSKNFRETTQQLGQIIADTQELRAAHWQPPIIARSAAPPARTGGKDKGGKGDRNDRGDRAGRGDRGDRSDRGKGGHDKRGRQRGGDKHSLKLGAGKFIPGTVSDVLRDNTRLCRAFNSKEGCTKGSGKGGKGCARGLHRCGKVLKTGRVCGNNSHGASSCSR